MKTISSVENLEIKQVVTLRTPTGRKKHQQFVVEGIRAIATFQFHQYQLTALYTTESMLPKAYSLLPNPQDREYYIRLVTNSVMRKISTAVTPSGILAVFRLPKPQDTIELSAGVALVNLQDPGNVGTLIRTAAALSAKTVVIVDGVDPWNPKVIQSSAGALASVNLLELNWPELVKTAHAQKVSLCGLVVKNGKSPEEIDFTNTLLIIGNEAHGLSKELQKECDQLMTIPMPGGTESLNAAVAGSIALYLAYLNKIPKRH